MAGHGENTTELAQAGMSIQNMLGARIMLITPAQGWFVSWVTDILIYIVVLNLFDEFFGDHIHFGSFWISVLAAVLFKILLVIVGKVEHSVHHQFESRGMEILALVGAYLVLFVGKLAIITIINRLFEQVHMHGLIYEVAMILTMIIASIVVWKIFDALGRDTPGIPSTKSRTPSSLETSLRSETGLFFAGFTSFVGDAQG